VAYVA